MRNKTLAALALAATAIGTVTAVPASANAAVVVGYVRPAYVQPAAGACWRWSHFRHRWVWVCAQPQYQPYYYQPYYYDPYYYAPAPFFGFSFGGGGYGGRFGFDHHRHH